MLAHHLKVLLLFGVILALFSTAILAAEEEEEEDRSILLSKLSRTQDDWPLTQDHRDQLNEIRSSKILYITPKEWGVAPKTCVETAAEANKDDGGKRFCQPEDLEVYAVKYDDCGEEVLMCRCKKAQVGIRELAIELGKIPIKARQWVRHIMAMPDTKCHAWAWPGADEQTIVILGPCHNNTAIYFHEVGHLLDSAAAGLVDAYSDSKTYQDIVAQDSCISDTYAYTTWMEHFAQIVVMAAYHYSVGPVWGVSPSVNCMEKSLAHVLDLLDYELDWKAGDKCDGVLPFDNNVCKGKSYRKNGSCTGFPDAETNGRTSTVDRRNSENSQNSGASHTHRIGPVLTDEQKKKLQMLGQRTKNADFGHVFS